MSDLALFATLAAWLIAGGLVLTALLTLAEILRLWLDR
jgi:hypothetical protein